jgi:hypothetical protein
MDYEGPLLRAIELALAGDWESAHGIVDLKPDDPLACLIHGALHRINGESGNAAYWYQRAGRPANAFADPRDELRAIYDGLKQPMPGTRH